MKNNVFLVSQNRSLMVGRIIRVPYQILPLYIFTLWWDLYLCIYGVCDVWIKCRCKFVKNEVSPVLKQHLNREKKPDKWDSTKTSLQMAGDLCVRSTISTLKLNNIAGCLFYIIVLVPALSHTGKVFRVCFAQYKECIW